MVRIVEQHVALSNGVKAVAELIEPQMAQTRHRLVDQIGFTNIREANKVFKVMVASARQHRVVVGDRELIAQHLDHRVWHIALIDKAHRFGGQALFQARGHQLHQTRFHLVYQVIFGITGHLHRIGVQRVVVKEAFKDIIQAVTQNVI